MSKQKISKIAKYLLLNDSRFTFGNIVAYGDLDLLHEIFERAGMKCKISHPINKMNAVLNALDRECKEPDSIFEKSYFRSYKGLARMFTMVV